MKLQHSLAITLILLCTPLAQAADDDIQTNIDGCNKAIAAGDASRALAYAERVLKQDKSNRSALLCKGRALGETGQYKEALAALDAAEKLSATPLEHMVALTLTGNVYRSAKQFPEALDTYRKSLALARAEKDKRFERINLNQIGDTLIDKNEPNPALENYLAGSKLANNGNERGDSYARIASTYSLLDQHDKAIEFQIKAVLAEEGAGDFDHYANANLELGRIYTAAKEYPNAEKTLVKIIATSKQEGSAYWEAKGDYYLALAKAANGQSQSARNLLNDAQHICVEIGAQELGEQISQALKNLPH